MGFFLAGNLLPFNSIVLLSDIGEGGEAVVCFTDSTECCIRRGAWLQPSSAYVRIGTNDFASHSRADRIILLNRMNFVPGLTGIFTCLVPSAGDSTALPYYVGIYESAGEGESYSKWQLHFLHCYVVNISLIIVFSLQYCYIADEDFHPMGSYSLQLPLLSWYCFMPLYMQAP